MILLGETQEETYHFIDSAKFPLCYDFVLSCYLRAVRIPTVDPMNQAMTSNENDLKPQTLFRVYAYSYMVKTFICVLGELKSLTVPMTQCFNPHYRLIMSGKHNKPGQKSLWREI